MQSFSRLLHFPLGLCPKGIEHEKKELIEKLKQLSKSFFFRCLKQKRKLEPSPPRGMKEISLHAGAKVHLGVVGWVQSSKNVLKQKIKKIQCWRIQLQSSKLNFEKLFSLTLACKDKWSLRDEHVWQNTMRSLHKALQNKSSIGICHTWGKLACCVFFNSSSIFCKNGMQNFEVFCGWPFLSNIWSSAKLRASCMSMICPHSRPEEGHFHVQKQDQQCKWVVPFRNASQKSPSQTEVLHISIQTPSQLLLIKTGRCIHGGSKAFCHC